MNRTTIIVAVGLAFAATLSAVPAQAQRVFVSGTGVDTNPCTFASPCRSFQHAHDVAPAGGEIAVLDTAGYGAVTITKSISIVNPGGVEAGIAVSSGGTAVTISAGPTDAVSLRGLTIDGGGRGSTGIVFTGGRSLIIQNCVVRNFQSSGIGMSPSGPVSISITNTLVAENGGHGIYLQPTGNQPVYAIFNRVEAYHNALEGIGIFGNTITDGTTLQTLIVDSVAAYNKDGFYSLGETTSQVNDIIRINRSTSFGNTRAGLYAETNGVIIASQVDTNEYPASWVADSTSCIGTYSDNYTWGSVNPCPYIGSGVFNKK
jgi:hypothetical protein